MGKKMYKVTITETYQKVVCVEAASPREAHIRARDAYNNTEITLDSRNLQGTEYYVSESDEYTGNKIESIEGKV